MKKSIVLQSVDSPRRDMEWRLFMAARLAERGISSIIGSKSAIRAIHARSSDCIFLGRLDSNTGRTAYDRDYVKEMEKKGTALFFLHDEGGLYYKGEYEDWVRKIYPEEYFSSEAVRKVLFWGDAQREVFANSIYREKFEVTGFPRFDLCKPEFSRIDTIAVSRLKKKYGSFVLICGRFAAVNMVADDPSALGKRSFDIRVEGGALKTKNREEILRSMFASWEKVSLEFSQFVPAVARLALDFPDLNFVLRPHPAEKESFYQDAFGHFDNIFIDKSGDVRPFIRASKALIHSECTTGLEAELSSKSTINFRPCVEHPSSYKYEVAGVSDIGVIVKDYNGLKRELSEISDQGFHFLKSEYDASNLALNFRGLSLSVDIICDLIEDFSISKKKCSRIKPGYNSLSFIRHYLIAEAKSFVKFLLRKFGVERFKKVLVGKGDLKSYEYTEEQLNELWSTLDPENVEFLQRDGVIFVCPKACSHVAGKVED
ncbi:surface carbohydrate biosynthesis protein [Marinobacter alexandrii]|uniref:surface carbohydrate biosynthesis protein n=1 Tax=Marinobacter alexandrii TaxID=2570351 RepID=UPI002ABE93DA|nr:surface carbohydrate biosynthesis protein [Marinobacter alexandrii]